MNFLEHYEPLLKAFWYIALPVSIFFLLQTISTFIGLSGSETDTDTDGGDGDMPFELFTLRNLINFLLGFSWTGISFYQSIENKTILIGISVLVGILFVGVFFLIIKQIMKLSEDNSFKIENTINKTAEVYLTIPEAKSGKGKIQISVNGSFHELDAITNSPEKLTSGSAVKVVAVEHNLVIVEKI
ncbi:NfeD family protein [Flavobacterium proteolyticum]|uniref:NfeD family protein n=1 Tax=Flavobacterium proteolyticum TaxID=2911683 RepID=A0ABR9WU33_9FLAO|nr:NfeD family protein [Flavobacterium proteolyticum]MBE9577160.1 NfeD family protein [Flavobacterium proteolyticum]